VHSSASLLAKSPTPIDKLPDLLKDLADADPNLDTKIISDNEITTPKAPLLDNPYKDLSNVKDFNEIFKQLEDLGLEHKNNNSGRIEPPTRPEGLDNAS
jgi:hypothetical protein